MSGRMPAFGRVAARLFTLQAAWSYERLQGIGFANATEPALRVLDGGAGGERYRAALARQSHVFNAHPYLAGLAIGAVLRAELDGESPERIVRLREALGGPLGSIGDRLFWASWLPACAAFGLIAYAFGARAWAALLFLVLYNALHLSCRVWGLRAGWERGLQVVTALQAPLLATAARCAAPIAAFAMGALLPVVFCFQLQGASRTTFAAGLGGAALVAGVLRQFGARVSGVLLAALVLGVTWVVGLAWW